MPILLSSRSAAALLLGSLVLVSLLPRPLHAEPTDGPTPAGTVLRLGPLPLPPAGDLDPRVHATAEVVPELDPHRWLPAAGEAVATAAGEVRWQRARVDDGVVALREPGVWWLAARLVTDRWAEVTVSVTVDDDRDGGSDAGGDDGGDALPPSTVWVDGERVDGAVALPAGACFVLARIEVREGEGRAALAATGEADLRWDLDARLDLSRFDRARLFSRLGSLAVAPRGQLVARHLSRRNSTGEGRRGETSVFDARGGLVASDLGGPDARPVAFTPDGRALLLRRPGEDGTDLLLWTAPRGPVVPVVTDEPGLGMMKLSADGQHLLLASTRGLDPDDPDHDRRRWDALRERVTDWSPRPHLHLLDLRTGARRVLTRPGDFVLDDAAWLPDGEAIVYARTLPQVPRPWFRTELRVLDLARGDDRLVATFTGGWEVRPQALTPHPDGRRVVFLGPPDEVGGGRAEHNVYQLQVWELDLGSGELRRTTGAGRAGQRYAFAAGRGLPAWIDGGRRLLLPALAGSREVLVALDATGEAWQATELPIAPETGSGWAADPEGTHVVYTASAPTQPAMLWLQPVGGAPRELEAPDRRLADRMILARPQDADFAGPGGETIEAWWYPPVGPDGPLGGADPASVPLIVYYYGGATATARGFNTTHQFWAAAGYAVLVINPRGARGYGQAFADHHAGDWGPAASADILAGVEALLARRPELDPDRVGCYGGSYGGFMTMSLITRSDLFAAAVSMYGIADLATYWGQGAWGWTYGDMALAGRTPWQDPAYFVERSPLFAAGEVRTPLLLLHGDADANVTPGESVEMFTALQVQGKPVEMVTFAGEDHGIAGTWANHVAHRTMMREWFDRWLLGRPQAWEHRWTD
jgi:dipeptidyl aminopeptidase/acylaminoacyl peptidase